MDTKETSAMTDASGLTNDQASPETSRSATASGTDMHRPVARVAEQLRKMTLAAPLPSLFAAFLFGVLVARRR